MNELYKYTCPKCGNKQYEIGEMWAIGSIWTRLFEIHSKRFTYLTCQKCRYTEFFKTSRKNIEEAYNGVSG